MNQTLSFDLRDCLTAVTSTIGWQSVCNIHAPTQTLDALGQADETDYTPVAGLQGIQCRMSPLVDMKPVPGETKGGQVNTEDRLSHVLLNGYYPTILKRYRAEIDGEPLDILAVESDSAHIMTRLAVRSYSL